MRLLFLSFITFYFLVGCANQNGLNPAPTEKGEEQKQSAVPDQEDPQKEEVFKRKYKFSIISDLNGSFGSKTYSAQVKNAVKYLVNKENEIDFVISTGDMVAGQRNGLDYKGMWNGFHNAVTRPLHKAKVALYPSPGNHDAHIGRATERRHYEEAWAQENPLPINKKMKFVEGVEQNFPFRYAFRVGTAVFIALDNTAVRPWKDSTLSWMDQVLEQEKNAKLKFVYGHVPLLPFAFKKETEYATRGSVSFLNKIEELFEKHKVDVFFSGHSHVYYPGRRDLHTEYISVPLLGSGSRHLISRQSGLSRSQKAFLVVEYDDEGNWSLEHRKSSDYRTISDGSFPKVIDIPSSNSSTCKACKGFPRSHMLDASKRIIYRRRDI